MKTCESCFGVVPNELLVTDKYKTASNPSEEQNTREICVLCKQYLPIYFNDCYDIGKIARIEPIQRTIRTFWCNMLNEQGKQTAFMFSGIR